MSIYRFGDITINDKIVDEEGVRLRHGDVITINDIVLDFNVKCSEAVANTTRVQLTNDVAKITKEIKNKVTNDDTNKTVNETIENANILSSNERKRPRDGDLFPERNKKQKYHNNHEENQVEENQQSNITEESSENQVEENQNSNITEESSENQVEENQNSNITEESLQKTITKINNMQNDESSLLLQVKFEQV